MKLRVFIFLNLTFTLGLFLLCSSPSFAATNTSQNPVGVWTTVNAEGVARSLLRIDQKNGVLYGKVLKILASSGKRPDAVCANCTGANQNKPIVGMIVLWGLRSAGNGSWEGGNILDVETGKVHPCSVQLSADGRTLNVSISSGMFTRNLSWPRAK